MASPNTEDQEIVLDTSHYNDVDLACQSVRARWRDLGTRLGVLVHTLDNIEANCNGKVERCMSAMIDTWLRRPLGEVRDVKPTWRSLCVALTRINRPLAERLAEEHYCGDISMSVSGATQSSNGIKASDAVSPQAVSPAFLPQMCGCGKCTIIGWRTGRTCQNSYFTDFPQLLIMEPKHPSASLFKQSYDTHATLCKATHCIIEQFQLVVSDIWEQLHKSVKRKKVDVSKITLMLRSRLGIQLPMYKKLDDIQNLFHSLNVSWYNFRAFHLVVTQIAAKLSPTLLADWNNYLTRFKEYCSARNLKDFKDVFFRVEEHNIFLLEVDELYSEFTLSDIEGIRDSLSIALGCPSVCLHLVTVRGGSLIIYFYYCFADYLTVFQSLTTEQLKMISQIKAYRIVSLTDLRNQFRYDNIQSYAEAPPTGSVNTTSTDNATDDDASFDYTYDEKRKQQVSLSAEVEILKKQSQFKDADLSRTIAELSIVCTDIKRKEEEIQELRRQLHSGEFESTRRKEESLLKDVMFSKKEAEMVTTIKKQKELIASLSREIEELKVGKPRVIPTFQKEMSGKPMKTITGLYRPLGVAVCDNGDIVVTECGAHCVTILNKEGKKVRSFGTKGTKEGHFTFPHGIVISNDGHILITDEHRVQKLTFDGICLQSVGGSEKGSGRLQFKMPRGITVHPTTGLTFVADAYNNRIQVFNSDLTFTQSITLHGDKQFNIPYDVTLDSEGCLYVAERDNHCITKLTATGQYITRFGSYGFAPGLLCSPSFLTVNNNLVYVSDGGNHRVSVFDTNGTFLHCIGNRGSGKGELNHPRGITTDTFGNLYVTDTYNSRIVMF